MFNRKPRASRATLKKAFAVLEHRAKDPRRKLLAEIIEAVLTRAGFTAAPIGLRSSGGYPKQGSTGFWMRVDSIGPGIVLDPTGYSLQIHNVRARQYFDALMKSFMPIIGVTAQTLILLDTEGNWHGVLVMLPTDGQLKALHRALARR